MVGDVDLQYLLVEGGECWGGGWIPFHVALSSLVMRLLQRTGKARDFLCISPRERKENERIDK